MAQDMDRAVAFYCDVIGLKVNSLAPMWSELAHVEATAISTLPDWAFRRLTSSPPAPKSKQAET